MFPVTVTRLFVNAPNLRYSKVLINTLRRFQSGEFNLLHQPWISRGAPIRISYMSTTKESDTKGINASEEENSQNLEVAEESLVKELEESISKLKSEIKEMQEKVLRSYAEEENVRRIAKRDVENAKAYANSSFAKSLLDVADNLERALAAVPEDKRTSEDPTIKGLLDGVDMTYRGLLKVFNQHGIQKVTISS